MNIRGRAPIVGNRRDAAERIEATDGYRWERSSDEEDQQEAKFALPVDQSVHTLLLGPSGAVQQELSIAGDSETRGRSVGAYGPAL